MKKVMRKISALLLAIVICSTAILPSEKIMADDNVTIKFADTVFYEAVLYALQKKIILRHLAVMMRIKKLC